MSKLETPEYAAMMRRMTRAYGRRLADGDPSDLAEAVQLLDELTATINAAARHMNTEAGFSWQQIADETGTTRQGAFQRFTRDAKKGQALPRPSVRGEQLLPLS